MQVLPAVVLAAGVWFLPESPRFLAERGELRSAHAVLSRLHHDPGLVEAEYQRIQDNLEAARDSRMGWLDLFRVPSLRRRVLLACGIQLFTISSGINVINYYGPRIYASLHFSTSRSLMIIGIYGALAQVYNTICIAFVDRVGRRQLLIPSMIGMGAALCVNATLAHYYIDGDQAPGSNGNALRASVAMYFVFSVFFTSVGCISWIFSSEVFPTAARAKGTSLSTFTNWAVNLILAQCSPIALTKLGYRYFYLFTAFNWTAAVVVYFCYPETQGHTLESVNELFGDLRARQEMDSGRSINAAMDVEKVTVPDQAGSAKAAS
ncbi:high-affinity hexose transporter [Cladophialophora carrionii]|uniref:High-affinity hexose transporter n=1 Tax=Cladophialophora carrionii TaxID=86049 RepID=A0A1C1CXB6_9EURO|nr:high-affinity hexose transporter [Cladophialophora carrionii]